MQMPIMQIQKLNVTLYVVLQNNIYTKSATLQSGRYAPNRGCQRQLTGVKIVAKKKPGGKPGEFFACYKRNKFIC